MPRTGQRTHNLISPQDRAELQRGRDAMAIVGKKSFAAWMDLADAVVVCDRIASASDEQPKVILNREGFGTLTARKHKTLLGQLRKLAAHREAVVAWHNGLSRETQWEWASPGAVEKHCPEFASPDQRETRREDNRARQARRVSTALSPRWQQQARDLEQANARIAELEQELRSARGEVDAASEVIEEMTTEGVSPESNMMPLERQIEQLCTRVAALPTDAEKISAARIIYRSIQNWLRPASEPSEPTPATAPRAPEVEA